MKFIIATSGLFPRGFAATNRLLAYYYGLQRNHAYVVGIAGQSVSKQYTKKFAKPFNDKDIVYYSPSTILPFKGFLFRRMNKLYGRVFLCWKFFVEIMTSDISAVIFSGRCVWAELIITNICKLKNIIILKEESENPSIYPKEFPHIIYSLWSLISHIDRYGLYNGLLLMTNPIYNLFRDRGYPPDKMRLIPHTVMIERFDCDKQKKLYENLEYIAFTGTLSEPKDGVLSLIKAFRIVVDKYPEMILVIAGNGTDLQIKQIQEEITRLELQDKLKFIGEIPSDDIPALICNAVLLVSARPPSVQAEYGFPTKIVEYLATGKPIVTTVYGDLASYLIDNENAFIATSSSPDDISAKIIEALSDLGKSHLIGLKGKELAEKSFNPENQTKLIINFVEKLQLKRKK